MTSRYKYFRTSVRHFLRLTDPINTMEQIRRQAFETFRNGILDGEMVGKNLNKLLDEMSQLTAEDVRLDKDLLTPRSRRDAPVTYIDILQHPRFTISMFVLRPGCKLPLHDHPNMYGICKVVKGKVKIRNFTQEPLDDTNYKGNRVRVRAEPDIFASEFDGPVVLTPLRSNIHEISAVDGGAAFVDVLAPPYLSNTDGLGPRPCHYFLPTTTSISNGCIDLLRVERAADYYTDMAPYQGD